jgi:hypothetical protein
MLFVDPSGCGFSLRRAAMPPPIPERSSARSPLFEIIAPLPIYLCLSYAQIKGRSTQIRERADQGLSPQLRSAGLSFSITDERASGSQTEAAN